MRGSKVQILAPRPILEKQALTSNGPDLRLNLNTWMVSDQAFWAIPERREIPQECFRPRGRVLRGLLRNSAILLKSYWSGGWLPRANPAVSSVYQHANHEH